MEIPMLLLDVLFYPGLIFLCASALYLLLLTCSSWFYRAKVNPSANLLKLVVIVPAYNEEPSITSTIDGIWAADYPPELLQIIVIADNCSDETAAVARTVEAKVVERFDLDNRGKGQALDWFLRQHQEMYEQSDGIVILDADSQPERLMLKQLSSSLSYPEVDVVQGFNGVGNSNSNWRTAVNTISFNVFNHLRMAGTMEIAGTSTLKGLGMGFRSSLLKQYGWPAKSLVEDLEFSLLLLQDGVNIHYNPDAVVTSEMATTKSQADSQRMRWEGGRFSLARKMLPTLFFKILSGNFRYIHVFMDLIIPPLTLLVMILLLWIVLALLLYPSHLVFLLGLFAALCFYVISAQIQRKLPLRLWAYLFAAPFFVLWKLPLYIKMGFGEKTNQWKRTTRTNERQDR
jgi:1,2-diacylglycerol 3-beta-glucosyltransferase